MLGQKVVATHSFIQSDGLVIQKGSIGTITRIYDNESEYNPHQLCDIEFITEGNTVNMTYVGYPIDSNIIKIIE